MKPAYPSVPLGELCDVLDSKRRPITKRDRIEGEFPYYGATGILGYVEGYIFDEPLVLIGEDGAKWGVGENTAFSAEGRYWVNNHAHVIRPHRNRVLDAWFIYQLNQADLSEFITGLTVPKLNQAKMREIPIIVPSLDEQRRIVAVLDKAFAGIATATANAQKNLTNARALFPTAVEEVLSRAANCKTMTLEQAADEACSLSYGIVQPGEEMSEGLPIVRPTDLRQKFIGLASLKRINPVLANSYRRTTLQGDDLLLCVRGTTGMMSVATPELAGGNVTRGIVPIRFNAALLSQELGYFLLRSASVQLQIKAATYGTALMQINIRDLKKLKICIPARGEQQAIASLLNAAQDSVEQLCLNYSTKLEKLANLKQSLLQKAFAGELT